jgi:hypothetical protein
MVGSPNVLRGSPAGGVELGSSVSEGVLVSPGVFVTVGALGVRVLVAADSSWVDTAAVSVTIRDVLLAWGVSWTTWGVGCGVSGVLEGTSLGWGEFVGIVVRIAATRVAISASVRVGLAPGVQADSSKVSKVSNTMTFFMDFSFWVKCLAIDVPD